MSKKSLWDFFSMWYSYTINYPTQNQLFMGVFTPQVSNTTDNIARVLSVSSCLCLVIGIGLLPVLILPVLNTPIFYGKIYVSTIFVSLALIFAALSVLRAGTLFVPYSLTLVGALLVGIVAIVSAALSGDVTDSLRTFSGTLYTAATITLGVFTLLVVTSVGQHSRCVRWLLGALGISSSLLIVWHTARLISKHDLSFGLFPDQTSSIFGSWTDVAIMSAGVIIALLFAVSQSLLRHWLRWCAVAILLAALFVLAVINNTVLWGMLGVVSLSIMVMAITRRQMHTTPSFIETSDTNNVWLLLFAGLVFLTTLTVFLGGDSLHRALTNLTNSSFVEVRPSVNTSLDIIRSVWSDNAVTGVGPAKYADAWRIHKPTEINETIFWNTDFTTGYNFFLTQAVEVGVLGLLMWFLFLGALVVSGTRTFICSTSTLKSTQYKLALLSFVLAVFLWSTFFIGNPGVPVFMLATALTGLYIGTSFTIRPRSAYSISLIQNPKISFVIVASLVVIVILVMWFLQQMTEQIMATTKLNAALSQPTDADPTVVSQLLAEAFTLHRTDTIARTDAVLQLNTMRRLLGVAEPTVEEQQAFQRAVRGAIDSSMIAASLDQTDPENWYVQAQIYTVLTQAEVEGALERAKVALDQAEKFDPHNPRVPFARAELAVLEQDTNAAREQLTAAIQKKSNYTPALYLLAQLEIAEGNVTEAITITESIIDLEPNNPARWYQLGVLYNAGQEPARALQALNQAIALDEKFANAFYVRALLLAESGRVSEAEADLARVLELNPDNETVQTQLSALRDGTFASTTNPNDIEQVVADSDVVSDIEVISEAVAKTDLVTTTTNKPDIERVESVVDETPAEVQPVDTE